MAGPMMDAPCQASEFRAMARGRRDLGTSMGPKAVPAGPMKARLAPKAADSTRSSVRLAKPKTEAATRTRAVVISAA